MNILLSSGAGINEELMGRLTALPDTSIYLSLSWEDSLRIVREIKPEILIIGSTPADELLTQELSNSHPELEIYVFKKQKRHTTGYKLVTCSRSMVAEQRKPITKILELCSVFIFIGAML